jgi:hypothetical protein
MTISRSYTNLTILFERNAPWGNRKLKPVVVGNGGKYGTQIRALDDARLFVYQNNIWISFRDGPAFGYDKQVLNPLHLSSLSSVSVSAPSQQQRQQQLQLLHVSIRASETLTFCGRNMALVTSSSTAAAEAAIDPTRTTLQALTWVDPVTVAMSIPFQPILKLRIRTTSKPRRNIIIDDVSARMIRKNHTFMEPMPLWSLTERTMNF